jgi:flagellar hook assembly protein FlgD
MPNPFNAGTLVHFSLPKEGEASLEVYNILGQKVATLSDGRLPAGDHEVQWSGMDDRGIALPSGLYMLRLASGDQVAHKKMIIMK